MWQEQRAVDRHGWVFDPAWQARVLISFTAITSARQNAELPPTLRCSTRIGFRLSDTVPACARWPFTAEIPSKRVELPCWITRRAYWLMVPPSMYPRSDNITKPHSTSALQPAIVRRTPGTGESQNRHIKFTHHHGKAPAWRSRGPRRDFAAPAGEVKRRRATHKL